MEPFVYRIWSEDQNKYFTSEMKDMLLNVNEDGKGFLYTWAGNAYNLCATGEVEPYLGVTDKNSVRIFNNDVVRIGDRHYRVAKRNTEYTLLGYGDYVTNAFNTVRTTEMEVVGSVHDAYYVNQEDLEKWCTSATLTREMYHELQGVINEGFVVDVLYYLTNMPHELENHIVRVLMDIGNYRTYDISFLREIARYYAVLCDYKLSSR